MAGGLFALPKMYKITQNSLLKKHGIFCLTFSKIKNMKNCLQSERIYGTINWLLQGESSARVVLYQKEVNESNEGRNPSQLSADYDYLRLR